MAGECPWELAAGRALRATRRQGRRSRTAAGIETGYPGRGPYPWEQRRRLESEFFEKEQKTQETERQQGRSGRGRDEGRPGGVRPLGMSPKTPRCKAEGPPIPSDTVMLSAQSWGRVPAPAWTFLFLFVPSLRSQIKPQLSALC